MSDPDHIPGSKISDLYSHWLGRERKRLPPFIVLNPGPLHQRLVQKSNSGKPKGKKKMQYLDVSSDEDKSESEKGDDVDEEEEDEENEESEDKTDKESDEEDETLPPKIGPPRGKRMKFPSSTQPEEDRSGAAGPSKPPPRNQQLKREEVKPTRVRNFLFQSFNEDLE